jgi:ribose 5-phosphate isomerase B
MKIAIGADHAGFEYKNKIIAFLKKHNYEVKDLGAESTAASDYPDFATLVAKQVRDNLCDLGILICGTGIGMSIAANKVKGVRAALITSEFTAESSKTHNHANVITFGSRVNTIEEILKFIEIFLKTEKSNEPRHLKRVEKLGKYEEENE